MKPIFIFSLPRSGSTLVQRILNVSEDVATAPETWVMLPILSATGPFQEYSVYSSRHAKAAIKEFVEGSLSREHYNSAVKQFISGLFELASNGKPYFLEKTPRNLYFAEQINEVFNDEARYIYLVRNPLAIACSMIETWGGGYWNIYAFQQDFIYGIESLMETYDPSKHLMLRYEDLLMEKDKVIDKISLYLGIDLCGDQMVNIAPLKGLMGDPTGQEKYNSIESSRASAWKRNINSMTKVIMLKRLLSDIGRERIGRMGYDYDELVRDVAYADNYSFVVEIVDFFRVVYGFFYKTIQPFVIKDVLLKKLKVALR